MSEEEKKAIETIKNMIQTYANHDFFAITKNKKIRAMQTLLNLIEKQDNKIKFFIENEIALKEMNRNQMNIIEKQQKEIERLNEIINSKYYHDLKCRELEKEINEYWEDKIRELKEKVEEEQTGNPYDFIYMINELLGEEQ